MGCLLLTGNNPPQGYLELTSWSPARWINHVSSGTQTGACLKSQVL